MSSITSLSMSSFSRDRFIADWRISSIRLLSCLSSSINRHKIWLRQLKSTKYLYIIPAKFVRSKNMSIKFIIIIKYSPSAFLLTLSQLLKMQQNPDVLYLYYLSSGIFGNEILCTRLSDLSQKSWFCHRMKKLEHFDKFISNFHGISLLLLRDNHFQFLISTKYCKFL